MTFKSNGWEHPCLAAVIYSQVTWQQKAKVLGVQKKGFFPCPEGDSCVLETAFRRGHHYRSELTSDVCACAWVRVCAPVWAVWPRGRWAARGDSSNQGTSVECVKADEVSSSLPSSSALPGSAFQTSISYRGRLFSFLLFLIWPARDGLPCPFGEMFP